MHPEMLRQMIADHNRTAQAEARQGRLARALIRARRHPDLEQDIVIPVIPDYVDDMVPVTSRAA